MRPILSACVAAGAIAVAGCATIETLGENVGQTPYTPMIVAEWSGAPQGPFRAADGERVLTQYLVPARVAALLDDARLAGSDAQAAVGDRLFAVTDGRGVTRFCDAATPGGTELVCFEDADGDGAFDVGWTAAAYPEFPMTVRRWTGRRDLAAPARYAAANPLEGPYQQVAIRYLGRSHGRYGFALQVGGPDGFSDVAWSSRTSWLAPDRDGVVEFAGARLTILDTPRQGVIYALQSAMDGSPLTLQVSTATRTLDSLVAVEAPDA